MGWYIISKDDPLLKVKCRYCKEFFKIEQKFYFEDAKNNIAIHFNCLIDELDKAEKEESQNDRNGKDY